MYLTELCTATHCSGGCPEDAVSCPFDSCYDIATEKDVARAKRLSNLGSKAKERKAKAPKNADILYKEVATIPLSDKVRRKKAYLKAHNAARKVHNK